MGAPRIAYGFVAALLAGIIGPVALFLLPALGPAVCPPDSNELCEVGLLIWLWSGGFVVALAAVTWFLGLGWLFFVTFVAQLLGLLRLMDAVQSPWVLLLALLIPVISALVSNRWAEPPHKGWQFWVGVGGSIAAIVIFGVWLAG